MGSILSPMNQEALPKGRRKLVAVIRTAGDVINIDDAVDALAVSRSEASKLLSRWAKQGWLRRISSGVYVPVPLDSLESSHVLTDPWILVPALFDPAYIGGRTAAEYWDLTEQLFRDIVVFTTRSVRRSQIKKHGAQFTVHSIQNEKLFGLKTIWRDSSRIYVSDVHRTIIDMLNNPQTGGGIQHVSDCFAAYMKRSDRQDNLLIEYADRLGNGAVFKRLGFISERLERGSLLANECKSRLTKGNAKLDSNLDCSRLVSKWHLWIPKSWAHTKNHD